MWLCTMLRACQSALMMQFEDDGCASFLHTSASTLNAAQLVCGELNPKANSTIVSKDDAPVPKAQTSPSLLAKPSCAVIARG